jgi:hypothetical protein
MPPKHFLMPHHAHSFIVNVQPSFSTTTAPVRVEHVDRIVPAACGLAAMVKHPIELVVHRLHRFPGNGCHGFWDWPSHKGFLVLASTEKTKEKNRTRWDFELR